MEASSSGPRGIAPAVAPMDNLRVRDKRRAVTSPLIGNIENAHSPSPRPAAQSHVNNGSSKRKKANRACAACQQAHLTCDDGRPCARCIKRGAPEDCHDGKRKKAKYLRDIEDDLVEQRGYSPSPSAGPGDAVEPPTTESGPSLLSHIPVQPELFDAYKSKPDQPSTLNDTLGPALENFDPLADASFYGANFDSTGANLEYSILSSMLNGFDDPALTEASILSPVRSIPDGLQQSPNDPAASYIPGAASAGRPSLTGRAERLDGRIRADPSLTSPFSRDPTSPAASVGSNGLAQHLMKPDEVYINVNKPYPYVQSYHDLIRHLKDRFERADIVRVIRALALYRPSLIALQMPLSEEDEIFVEKCFQRTLIEYEKMISLTGTPTVVWRRTSEICLVGAEFCTLTKWRKEDLVGRKRYIFELMDCLSVVEYYEQMAQHSFENTTSTVMTTCRLLTPKGEQVSCSFCFSIKRDLFSVPSLIIGQFLPIGSDKP